MSEGKYQSYFDPEEDQMADVPATIDRSENISPEHLPAWLDERNYVGIASAAFTPEQCDVLTAEIDPNDIEIRPDGNGMIYLPQVKYRRILNQVFKPGGWALIPRSDWAVQGTTLTRCYALIVLGRFVSEAIGEQHYIANNPLDSWATASEGVRSDALTRCCKDLGIASECWDPGYIESWKRQHAIQVWCKSQPKPQWRRKDREPFWDETGEVKQGQRREYTQDQPKQGQGATQTTQAKGNPQPAKFDLWDEIVAHCKGDKKAATAILKELTGKTALAAVTEPEALTARERFRLETHGQEIPTHGQDSPESTKEREPGAEG